MKMLKKLIFAVVFLTFCFTTALAQVPSPQPRCVSVLQPSGDVTITWTPSVGPVGQFDHYTVYMASVFGGPYAAQVPTITVQAQSSATIVGANANVGIRYFYIQTTYNSPGPINSAPIDTISSILVNAVPGAGTANICWNQMQTPLLNSSSGVYNIYMEYPAGSGIWNLTGTTTSLCFIDTVFQCNNAINYRVEIADNTGCVSVSSVDGGVFQNIIVPSTPSMDTVSVNNNNHPMMNWTASTAPDVAGYVIYISTNGCAGPFTTIDTVLGMNNTSYTYLTGNADADSLTFRVAAFDLCGNISPAGNCIQTIYLTTVANICNHSATLTWTAYPSIGNGLAGYNVYQATTIGGPYSYLGTVPPGTLTFSATGLSTSTTYYFKVTAFDFSGNNSSSSNRKIFYCAAPIPPNFLYCVSATVGASNRIDVTAFVDTAASVLGYKVMRSTLNSPNLYEQVGMIAPTSLPIIMFSDYNADTDNKSYYYTLINVDSCGFDGMESNVGRSIHCTAQANSNFTNTIKWNKYEAWDGNVLSYHVYRGLNGLIELNPIGTINPSTLMYPEEFTFVDTTVWGELNGDGNFYYQIEAVEGAGTVFNFGALSRSNIAIAKQEPEMFIPNAFVPAGGVNTVFVPVTTWANYSNYQFDIFNRFGENIFSTSKIGEGWDGSRHGRNCESGVYVYLIKYRNAKGEDFQRKGIVTLVR